MRDDLYDIREIRRWVIIVRAMDGAGIVLFLIGVLLKVWFFLRLILAVGGLGLIIAAALLSLYKFCCPRCGKLLRVRNLYSLQFCPYCGAEFAEFPEDANADEDEKDGKHRAGTYPKNSR